MTHVAALAAAKGNEDEQVESRPGELATWLAHQLLILAFLPGLS